MHWTPVKSSAFTAVGYDAAAERLRIRFKDGLTYEFRNVPAQAHAALLLAESKGQHFNLAIRGRFPFEQVTSEAR